MSVQCLLSVLEVCLLPLLEEVPLLRSDDSTSESVDTSLLRPVSRLLVLVRCARFQVNMFGGRGDAARTTTSFGSGDNAFSEDRLLVRSLLASLDVERPFDMLLSFLDLFLRRS